MRDTVNIFITDNSVLFVSQTLTVGLSFEEQSMRQISEELKATLISNKLKELDLDQPECVFILSEDYYSVQTSVESFIKKQNNDSIHGHQLTYKSYFNTNATSSEVCSEQSKFLFQGKKVLDYSVLPLLQNYFVSKTIIKSNTQKYMNLISAFKKVGITYSSVIPFSEFASFTAHNDNSKRGGETVIISFHKSKTYISVYQDNFMQYYNNINYGFSKIVEDVSDQFNVSLKTAKKLIELYGYVFLPKKYINFVVDVPVYGDIYVEVKLTELSYCIRESLRNMMGILLQDANVNDNVNFIFYSDTEIREFSKLVGLMLNADAKDLSLSQLNYQTVKNSILAMKKFEIEIANTSEKQEEEEEHIYEKNEKFSIKEKLSGLIDIHVKPWLLESEKV
ncbi:MAG: cell division FtsA domain-containing protein [Bacteroidales bacterium]|nr:cell division FtsA domain-containing protein [Bacteroidales bacterium]MDD4218214.1 cell division FtsA domain-containing protein [Bacteroidales bacterium]MDY0143113.1 cell division protein FtsA [Bacteroidales bacterium]